MGTAIRSFDAWMLADEQCLTRALNRADHPVCRQPDPEEITEPKRACTDLCNDGMALADLYTNIAATINLDALRNRCPRGFAPFAARVCGLSA